jgi:hypothetical protein
MNESARLVLRFTRVGTQSGAGSSEFIALSAYSLVCQSAAESGSARSRMSSPKNARHAMSIATRAISGTMSKLRSPTRFSMRRANSSAPAVMCGASRASAARPNEREISRRFFRHVSPSLKKSPFPPIALSRSNAMPLG